MSTQDAEASKKKPYSRPPSRAGSPEVEDTDVQLQASLRATTLKTIWVDRILEKKESDRPAYVWQKLMPILKPGDTRTIVENLFPRPSTPPNQPRMQVDHSTPTAQRVASPATYATQIPPTQTPLNPSQIHVSDSVEYWKKAVAEIPGLPFPLVEGIPYSSDEQAARLVKTHSYQLTRGQLEALKSLLPILNEPAYYVPDPDPFGPLLTNPTANPPSTHPSPRGRARSVTPEVERSLRRSPAPYTNDEYEEARQEGESLYGSEEDDDEEMEDAEEDPTRPQTPAPKLKHRNTHWKENTPQSFADLWGNLLKKTLLDKELPSMHATRTLQAVYDALKVICQTKRIDVQDDGHGVFGPTRPQRTQSRGRSTEKKDQKKDLAKEQARIKKQLLDTLKNVEQFEKDLSFLTKPEIIDLAAKKAAAPPQRSQPQQKCDPKNPWGKGSSLVKGIKANTVVLNHKEDVMADDIDTKALQTSIQETCGKDATVNRVTIAKSGAVIVETAKPMEHTIKKKIQQTVNTAAFGGKDATTELVRPTFSSLKFDFIPTRLDNGEEASAQHLTNMVRTHPKWEKVQFIEVPKLIPNKSVPGIATLLCKVADDDQGTTAKGLLRTLVRFGPELRRCKEWFNKPPSRQCPICQRWGHTAYNCRARSPYCAICAEPHPTASHAYSCKTQGCANRCLCDIERCINCNGAHPANSNTCPFWMARNNPTQMKALLDQKRKDRPTKGSSETSKAKGKRPASFYDSSAPDPSFYDPSLFAGPSTSAQ